MWSAERADRMAKRNTGGDRLVEVVMRLHAEFAGWATFRDVLMVIEQCCSARDTAAFAAKPEPVGRLARPPRSTAATPVGKRAVTGPRR